MCVSECVCGGGGGGGGGGLCTHAVSMRLFRTFLGLAQQHDG